MGLRIWLGLVLTAAAAVLQSSAQRTHQVGGNFGWNSPGGFSYSNWAAQQTFSRGDSLVFNFNPALHTVARVNEGDYDNCNTGGNPISLQTNSPATFILNESGPWYFFCTRSNHCAIGQKLLVNVTSNAESPAGSPGSSPTTPSGSNNTPPPPNSANIPTNTAASLILFMFMVMSFFLF